MILVVEKPEVVAQKEKLLKALGPAYVVLLPSAFLDVLNECLDDDFAAAEVDNMVSELSS